MPAWFAYRFALVGAFLYTACKLGMQSSEPHNGLNTAGSSAPFLSTTINPVIDDALDCQIVGQNCLKDACEEAGALCLENPQGTGCRQGVRVESGGTTYVHWQLMKRVGLPESSLACQNCECRDRNVEKMRKAKWRKSSKRMGWRKKVRS
jgi:hypothetical protein